ncbi:ankyrin repeat domain-containing protein [Qingshengfaniella alkalisoli]|uniref:Uncharacterized protein n=1 Tax=Qingshengfaniella alkalisoli TaxID=2599296 RepID=A0A5B8ISN6_9RHOB|nr:ankyrin repeat domain-containing protein [Qingshengfaniella alkalisoli]QDY68614.1 hypothetical protein FPZ52_02585 [Qingshengfaniella alkalisoli]
MTSLDNLRRQAKTLKKAYDAGDPVARQRIRAHAPRNDGFALKHADFLHVIAREAQFASWPRLKFAAETVGLDRADKQQRLKVALYHGRNWAVEQLLAETPDLADGLFGLQVALYDLGAVRRALQADPDLATRAAGPRTPILHLAFSRYIHAHPEKEADMIAIAELLLAHGADINDGMPESDGSDHKLSALYGAIGHTNNMPLAKWLLEHGANPNDNESLYHATELGHHDGLKLLIEHGADPKGTNALLHALDYNDAQAVRLLLAAGANANEGVSVHPSGQPEHVIAALHQAARRMCDGAIARLLIDAGANPSASFFGVTPYALARVYGNDAVADEIAQAGGDTTLSEVERLLVKAARGEANEGVYVDPAPLPHIYGNLIGELSHLPGKLEHMKQLVALGLEYDRPDAMGVTPVQSAGWQGRPEVMTYLLSLRPDLSHVNNYGGTLLGTIIHGSENCERRAERDHITCARLALEHGVALLRHDIDAAGNQEMSEFLRDWAENHPGQVIQSGV